VIIISADQLESLQKSNKKVGMERLVVDESLFEPGTLLVTEWYTGGKCLNYAINDRGKVKRV
jgi:hypothetical protein